MGAYNPTVATLAAGLAAIVGFCDTLGVLSLLPYLREVGHGLAASNAATLPVLAALAGPSMALVLAFLSGVIAGSLTGHYAQHRRRQAVLLLVAVLLVVAALLHSALGISPAVLFMIMALGALHGVLEDVPGVVIGLFETLGRLGERLASPASGRLAPGWTADVMLWTGVVVGITAAFFVFPNFGLAGLWLPAALAALLALWSANSGLHSRA